MDEEQESQEEEEQGIEIPGLEDQNSADSEQEGSDGQEDNGNEGDPNDEEQQQEQRRKAAEKKEEAKIDADLKKLDISLNTRQIPLFTPNENKTIEKAKKKPKFIPKIMSIFAKLAKIITKLFSKIFSIISPALPYIGIGLLVFLAIAMLAYIFFMVKNSVSSGDGDDATYNSSFGVKGDKFYGVRTLYEDDEKAVVELVNEYYMVISETATEIQKITSIPGAGEDGKPAKVAISVSLELLEEDAKIEKFEETEFSSTYPTTYKLINDIATEVYKVDNGETSQPATLTDTLKEIKYFGFDSNLNTTIKDLVADYIINQGGYSYTATDGATLNKTTVDAEVQKKIDVVFNKEQYKTRTEKLFIKDFIFTSVDKGMENIKKENYKAAIFMPKQNVTFNSFWLVVIDAEMSQFNLTFTCNGDNVNLTKSKEGMFGDEADAYNYKSNAVLNKTVSEYNYVELPKSEISVFDLLGDDQYADLLKDGKEAGIKEFNFKEDEGCVITFENGSESSFGWYEQDVVYK